MQGCCCWMSRRYLHSSCMLQHELLGSYGTSMQHCILEPRVGLFNLRLGHFYLRLVFVAYGNLLGSFLLTVQIRFGLLGSSLLTVEIRFGLLCSRRKIGLVFCVRFLPVRNKCLNRKRGCSYWNLMSAVSVWRNSRERDDTSQRERQMPAAGTALLRIRLLGLLE